MRRRYGKKRARARIPMGLRLVLVLAFFAVCIAYLHVTWSKEEGGLPENASPGSGGLAVTFFDVGQGDAVLLRCGGEAMLVDAGTSEMGEHVVKRLSEMGVARLEAVVLSHPHADHIGGMEAVMRALPCGECLSALPESSTYPFALLKAYFGERFRVVSPGETFSLGEAEITVLGPPATGGDLSVNNQSMVLRADYGLVSFFLTGDMEFAEESMLLRETELLPKAASDGEKRTVILKCGHHGGSTSSSWAFLEALDPETAVISCGAGNEYGHPSGTVLRKLSDRGVRICRTDLQGEVEILASPEGISISTERSASVGDLLTPGVYQGTEEESLPEVLFQGTDDGYRYILNNSSKKFHRPGCEYAEQIGNRNRDYSMESRQELIRQGYTPCGACRP